jgi:hypothetical protein
MTKSPPMRESAVMISSTIPSAKYSCSGSPLKLTKGRTAIEGLSRTASAGLGGLAVTGLASTGGAGSCSSRTTPTKRMPLRGTVRIRRCACPLSPTALRAALMRLVIVVSETTRPPQIASRIIPADDPLAVANQINQEVKDLRFERDPLAATPEFTPVNVKYMIAKDKFHGPSSEDRSDGAILNESSTKSQRKINLTSALPQSLQGGV